MKFDVLRRVKMTPRIFFLITATLFSLIALLHALRLLRGWQVTVGDIVVPLWVSWVGLIMAGYLAYEGFKLGRRIRSELRVLGKQSLPRNEK